MSIILTRTERIEFIKEEYQEIVHALDERRIRLWCAARARAYNREYQKGGVMVLYRATGVSRSCIYAGIAELSDATIPASRIRKKGGGRKAIEETQQGVRAALDNLVEPESKGDPESPLRWTCKSTPRLSTELRKQGYKIGKSKVHELLCDMRYSLQGNRKNIEGVKHPDRDAQFKHIYSQTKDMHKRHQPVISVDTKKKENIGNFKNNGREYRPVGTPKEVNVYDFIDKAKGKVAPYGIYDLLKNDGFVNVGVSADTAEFAVNSIRSWWYSMGKEAYPKAKEIMITADCGGSNGYRVRLWKHELQKLATEIGLTINVSHFPPGTSKWNKIEHCLFSFISQNWRGEPLLTEATVVKLIAATTTTKGLTVKAELDKNTYEKGRVVSDEEMSAIKLSTNEFHGEWNYSIKP